MRSLPLKAVCKTNDERVVSFPMDSSLFCAPGAGKNYVHGGCSPQEMLVPLIEVKTERANIIYYSCRQQRARGFAQRIDIC